MEPTNHDSNKSFNMSLSSTVEDNNPKAIQEDKIYSLSTQRLLTGTSSTPLKTPKIDQSSVVSFSDPENALLKIYPKLQKIPDPFVIEEIVVPGPEGQENVFYIRRRSLARVSPIYEGKNCSGSWENCIWKKNDEDYYHLKAAAQVVLFALFRSGDVDSDHYQPISQTLETLKSKKERLIVLEDILILSDLYFIKGLQEECRSYLQAQMTSIQAISDYFDICVLLHLSPNSHLEDLWEKAVGLLSEYELENVLALFDELTCQIRDSLPLEKQVRAFQVLGKSFRLIINLFFNLPFRLESDSENERKINPENIEMFFKSALNIYYHFEDSFLNLAAIRDAARQCHYSQTACPESSILYFLLTSQGLCDDEKKIDNTNDLHLIYLGLLHLQKGKIEQAFDCFNSALQIRSDRIKLIECCKVMHFIKKADYKKALEILNALQVVDSGVLADKGYCFAMLGEQDQALINWDLALQRDFTHANALLQRGNYFSMKGERDKAFNDWNLALEHDCNNTSVLMHRGIYFSLKGEHDKALNDWNLALKVDPKHIPSLISRGMYYDSQKEDSKALQDWNLILRFQPKDIKILYRRSRSLLRCGRRDEALKDLDTAHRVDPKNVKIIYVRVRLLCDMGKWDKALEDLNRILRIAPMDKNSHTVNAHYLSARGEYYHKKGEAAKAKADIKSALELDPTNELALWYKSKFERGF
jgi:tetratricopeptide (TPR) repeat protein